MRMTEKACFITGFSDGFGRLICRRAVLLPLMCILLAGRAGADIAMNEWHRTSVHGHPMFYATKGHGATLLLLHGGGDSGEHSFAYQLDEFAEHHLIVVPDQVGQGRTPDVKGPLPYTGMMEDTAALLQHLKYKHVDVVGWSDGGILALMLAVRHPELVRRLVVSGVTIAPEGLNPDDLEELAQPVLVISGDRDAITLEHTLKIFHALPVAELCVLPGTDHATFTGRSEWLNPIIHAFLDRPLGPFVN